MNCKNCPWKHPEICKVCKQDEKKPAPKPDITAYGLFHVTKISMN